MSGYRLSETAEAELADILDGITERDGVDRAIHVLDKLLHAFELLADSPHLGAVRTHLTASNVRWWSVLGFLVAYDEADSPITILRVIHGARDLDRLFRAD